jgi:hypothetical protein
MFELRGNRSVGGAKRPAVAFLDHPPDAGREERLDRKDQSFAENALIVWIIEIQDFFWILV